MSGTTLAANLSPNEIFLAKYDINSINTNKAEVQEASLGTNKKKILNHVFETLILLHPIQQ